MWQLKLPFGCITLLKVQISDVLVVAAAAGTLEQLANEDDSDEERVDGFVIVDVAVSAVYWFFDTRRIKAR